MVRRRPRVTALCEHDIPASRVPFRLPPGQGACTKCGAWFIESDDFSDPNPPWYDSTGDPDLFLRCFDPRAG